MSVAESVLVTLRGIGPSHVAKVATVLGMPDLTVRRCMNAMLFDGLLRIDAGRTLYTVA